MALTPYQRSARKYLKRGWSPVPMTRGTPEHRKGVPLVGFTGHLGAVVDEDNIADLLLGAGSDTHPDVAVRAHGWVGIDVDDGYPGTPGGNPKCGAAQLAEVEEIYGKLPATYFSTARGPGASGIWFYRIPQDILILPEGHNFDLYGDSIEVIRFAHRYAKCWPTVHPNGELYRWYASRDEFLIPEGECPAVTNLAHLPDAWLAFLSTEHRERVTVRSRREAALRGSEDRVFPTLASVEHFLASHRRHAMETPGGSGFNQALNDYAHALSAFVPEFYDEDEARTLLHQVVETQWPTPNAADRATINSGLIRSRQPFYARRPTAEEEADAFSPHCIVAPTLALPWTPRPVAPWLLPAPPAAPAVNPFGEAEPQLDDPDADFTTGRICDARGRVEGEPLDALFSDAAFPMFGHLRQFARARGVSPVAALGVLLTRISTAIPVYVVTPAFIGSHGSLNSFVCLIGRAGTSKGGATGAAQDAVAIAMTHTAKGVRQYEAPPYSPKIGSGQGVAAQFAHRRRPEAKTGDPGEVIRDRDAVLFTCSEVSDLTAKSAGNSTLLATICEIWVGEALGSSYVDPAKRLPVAAMSYRACFVLHAQPDLLGPLLIDAAPTGAPQRFLYLPVVDTFRPDNEPLLPPPIEWSGPSQARDAGAQVVVPVCARAERAIKNQNRRMHAGLSDPLDGHALFARLKTAVAINASRGLLAVDDLAWSHAGALHDLGKQTRTDVINYLHAQKRAGHRAAAEAEGRKEIVKTELVRAEETDKGLARIIEVLTNAPVYTLTKRDVQKRCSRKWAPDAFDLLCSQGAIIWKTVELTTGGAKEKTVYALSRPP